MLLNDITVRRTDTDGVEKDLPLRDQTGLVGTFLFANPEEFYSDVDKELGKPGVLGFEWFPSSNDLDAFEQKLEPIYTDKGFTITKAGEYGGGPVYAVKNGTGVTRYFNTVLTKDKTGVLLVVWKHSPV